MANKQSNVIRLNKEVLATCNNCGGTDWQIVLDKPIPDKILKIRCPHCRICVDLKILDKK